MIYFRIVFLLLLLFSITSCVSNFKYFGHKVTEESIQEIKENKTSKEEVIELIGSPSIQSQYGQQKWFYISSKLKYQGFLKSKIAQQEVLMLSFDDKNIVKNIEFIKSQDEINFHMEKDYTQSKGIKENPLKHIAKNIGRFNQPARSKFPQ